MNRIHADEEPKRKRKNSKEETSMTDYLPSDNKKEKRSRKNSHDLDDFIVDDLPKGRRRKDSYDLDDYIIYDEKHDKDYIEIKPKEKLNSKLEKKLKTIEDEIDKRDITEKNILELNLSIDDNIWFVEHFKMLDGMDTDTDERYKLKQKIYTKYKQVTSSSYKSLKDKYGIEFDPDENMIGKIFASGHSDRIKSLLFTKFMRASEKGSSEEYFKATEWIDYVLRIPTKAKLDMSDIDITEKLSIFWKSVNSKVYGLFKVKEKMLGALNTYLMSEGKIGRVITLVGPPGVGKTSIAEALAEATNLPFNSISMSDVTEESILLGHSSTYTGAHPGLIADVMMKNGRLDNFVLLDEIDKTVKSDGKNVTNTLIKMLDPVQNSRFNDAYMPELDIDLSQNMWVATANKIEDIPSALLDRLYIIYIDGYEKDDKIQIGTRYIIPKMLESLKLCSDSIVMTDDVVAYLISKLDDTKGVRNLKEAIKDIFDRILLMTNLKGTDIKLSYKIKKVSFPFKIEKEDIDVLWKK